MSDQRKLRPIRNQVVIKPDSLKEKIGHIIIPESARKEDQLHTGTIVAAGPGMPMYNGNRWPMTGLEPGQRCFYKSLGAKKARLWDEAAKDEIEHHIVLDEAIPALIDD
jgi:co-chaperonin GroES (HSP10)